MKNNILRWRRRLLQKAGLKLDSQSTVLDVGCGDGGDCAVFAGEYREVFGIDIKRHPDWASVTRTNVRLLVADACHLPFPDNMFDIVFAKDVLHHIENHKKAIDEMGRVAKRGSRIIIMEANRYNPIFYLHMTLLAKHQHFTQAYFQKLMRNSFDDVSFLTIESHVYPAITMPLLRLINRIEDMLEGIPLLRKYLSYNIVLAEKSKVGYG